MNKKRGNGQGTVYRMPNGKFRAIVTIGWKNKKRLTRSKTFVKKSDAIAALPELKRLVEPVNANITFLAAYNEMIRQHAKRVEPETIDGYNYAIKHLQDLVYLPLRELKTDHYQQYIDECPAGKRTKENMKAAVSLTCKYGMKNDIIDRNYGQLIVIEKEEEKEREPFTGEEVKKILAALPDPVADIVACLIFTGVRPNELFKLRKTDFRGTYFVGGSKTPAGKKRIIPIATVILPIIQRRMEAPGDYIFSNEQGKKIDLSNFRKRQYYPFLEQIGVRHLPPYSCRHTFATFLKDIEAPITDKKALMGHSSFAMTAHYTHTNVDDLQKISEQISQKRGHD